MASTSFKTSMKITTALIFFAFHVGVYSAVPFKIILTQPTIQFVEFRTSVPNLQDFTVCYWLKSVNTTNRQSTFSYAAPDAPEAIAVWVEPTIFGTQIRMALNGLDVYSVPYTISSHRWYHICHSWEGASGRWKLYVGGDLVGHGSDFATRPPFIPGGGIPVFGQQQNNFDLSPERPGGFQAASGVEGEMTLLFFDSRPLRHNLASLGASGNVNGEILGTKLTDDITLSAWGIKEPGRSCFDQPSGNIVAWGITDINLVGGAVLAEAKPSCGDF